MVRAGSDDPYGSATATLLDPSFPSSLGSDARERMLIDLNVKIELVGGNVAKLCPGSAYVIYASAAPVRYVSDHDVIQIPTQGRRAGVSRVLGACLPWGPGVPSSIRVAELFCGGLGGWSSAAKLFRNIQTVLALDVDLDAASWFAKNHDSILLDSGSWGEVQTAAPGQLLVLACDINDWRWFETLSKFRVKYVLV